MSEIASRQGFLKPKEKFWNSAGLARKERGQSGDACPFTPKARSSLLETYLDCAGRKRGSRVFYPAKPMSYFPPRRIQGILFPIAVPEESTREKATDNQIGDRHVAVRTGEGDVGTGGMTTKRASEGELV